jgi:hypothetical protein
METEKLRGGRRKLRNYEPHSLHFPPDIFRMIESRRMESQDKIVISALSCFFSLMHSSTLKVGAICYTERSADFQRNMQYYIAEHRTAAARF